MEENKKEYSVIGTVTIGTDEYRDLLDEKYKAEKEKYEWHDKWYSEYCEKNKLTKELEKLKEELSQVKELLNKVLKNQVIKQGDVEDETTNS